MEIFLSIVLFTVIVLIYFRKEIKVNKNNQDNQAIIERYSNNQNNILNKIELKEEQKLPEIEQSIKTYSTEQKDSTFDKDKPNKDIYVLPKKDLISNESKEFKEGIKYNNILIGKADDFVYEKISNIGNILIGGTSGSGKSTFINSIICNILMNYKPEEVKLALIDPKKIELSNYNGVPHLLWPVITNPKKANAALQRVFEIIRDRYAKFSEAGVKNIGAYNEWIEKDTSSIKEKMYYLVIVIDDLSELIKYETIEELEKIMSECNQVGINFIISTSNPTRECITNEIRINVRSRVCFMVPEKKFSKLIIDEEGAEKIHNSNEFLYRSSNNKLILLKTCCITDNDIEKIINYICSQQKTIYDDLLINTIEENNITLYNNEHFEDPLYNEIVEFAYEIGKISASIIQRRFRLGYNRAARLIDLLEERGIIGPQNGSKPREVLKQKK